MSSLLHLLGHGTGCRWMAHLAGTMKVRTYFSIYIIHQSALFAASKKHHNSTAKVKYLQQQQRQDNFYCTTVTTTTPLPPLPHHYHTTTTPPHQRSEQNEDVFLFVLLLQLVGNFTPSQIPVSCPNCSKPFHQEDKQHKPYYTRSPNPEPS